MSDVLDNLKTDLTFYRWGAVALLASLTVSATVVMLSQGFFSSAQASNTAAEKKLNDARRNLAAVEDDRQNMAAYAQEYSALLTRDIVASERPLLDWVEGLKQLQAQHIVLGFRYNIAAEQAYKPPVPVDSGNYALNMSAMTLSFDLLHEGQLVKFFDALRSNVRGFYMLDGCTVERLSGPEAGSAATGLATSLKAECHGEWITLKNRNAP